MRNISQWGKPLREALRKSQDLKHYVEENYSHAEIALSR